MHDQHPAPGGPPVRPEGNRPAHNARLSTPGALGAGSAPGGDGAGDFLGLGEELGVPGGPSAGALFQPDPVPQEPEPLEEVWEEYGGEEGAYDEEPLAEVVSLDDEASEVDPSWEQDELAEEYEEDVEPPEGVLAAWKEPEPRRRGRGKLVGLCVGVGIAGMVGVAGLKLVTASQQVSDVLPEPLAAHSNPLPSADRVLTPDTPAQGAVEPSRVVLDATGNATPTEMRAGFEPPVLDPAEQARAAFEAARGDAQPTSLDPTRDAPPSPAALVPDPTYEGSPMGLEHGSPTGKAELLPTDDGAVTEVAEVAEVAEDAPPAEGVALLAAGTAETAVLELVAEPPLDPVEPDSALAALAPEPDAALELAPADVPELVEPVAEGASESVEPAPVIAAAAQEAVPDPPVVELVDEPPQVSDPLPAPGAGAQLSSWLQVALQRGSPPPSSSAPQGAPPASPAGPVAAPHAEPIEPIVAASRPGGESPVETLIASREPRRSASVPTPAPKLPEPSGNLRQASSSDLATVWQSQALPAREDYDRPARLLTPNVGRVRVLLHSKDVFEGRLYGVGGGNVWLETQHGRMALAGARIASMELLTSREGTPTLGESGSQDLAGMERVRVKTPGGVFYGKIIARDEKTTTLVTDDGARLTLDSKMVELLVDAPKVTIKGTVPEKERPKSRKP